MGFRYKLYQFMQGRYGTDTFFYCLVSTAAVLAVINSFIRIWALQIIIYALMIYAVFRFLSKNINVRAAENRRVRKILFFISDKIKQKKARKADTSHIYKKCPYCKVTLKLPRRKGKHKTVCPKCGKEFTVRVYKD